MTTVPFYWRIRDTNELKYFKKMLDSLQSYVDSLYVRIGELRWELIWPANKCNPRKAQKILKEIYGIRRAIDMAKIVFTEGRYIAQLCSADSTEEHANVVLIRIEQILEIMDEHEKLFDSNLFVSASSICSRLSDLRGALCVAQNPHVYL